MLKTESIRPVSTPTTKVGLYIVPDDEVVFHEELYKEGAKILRHKAATILPDIDTLVADGYAFFVGYHEDHEHPIGFVVAKVRVPARHMGFCHPSFHVHSSFSRVVLSTDDVHSCRESLATFARCCGLSYLTFTSNRAGWKKRISQYGFEDCDYSNIYVRGV